MEGAAGKTPERAPDLPGEDLTDLGLRAELAGGPAVPATGQPLLGPRQPAAAHHPPQLKPSRDSVSGEGEAAGSMSRGT